MNDEAPNLVLEHLKHIRGAIDRMSQDMGDVKFRIGQLEQTTAHTAQTTSHILGRLDRIEQRLTTLETRAGLIDA